jgi:mannose-6-phosphate isomerase-like protein (cupin superfamily)
MTTRPDVPKRNNCAALLRLVLFLLMLACFSLPAQEQTPPGFNVWTPDSLQPYLAEMTSEAPSDPHKFAVRQLADYPNDGYLLVHREADGQVEWHETQADIFFVQSGSATLLLGGRLVEGETVGPHEKRNGHIEGGIRRPISAGDVVRIPPRVPHEVLLNGSREFNYFVVKIKGY